MFFNTTIQRDEPAEAVFNRVVAVATVSDYRVSAQPNLIQLWRQRRPTWTIVLAIVLFPIGLLFLLKKKSEQLNISIGPRGPEGCTVVVSGEADQSMVLRIQAAVGGASIPAIWPPPPVGVTVGTPRKPPSSSPTNR